VVKEVSARVLLKPGEAKPLVISNGRAKVERCFTEHLPLAWNVHAQIFDIEFSKLDIFPQGIFS